MILKTSRLTANIAAQLQSLRLRLLEKRLDSKSVSKCFLLIRITRNCGRRSENYRFFKLISTLALLSEPVMKAKGDFVYLYEAKDESKKEVKF